MAAGAYLSRGAPKRHEESFDLLLAGLSPINGEHVLDVGCGGGRLIERLLGAGAPRVYGLDHSAAMLRATRRRNTVAYESCRLELREGDAHRVPWPDRSFATVIVANAFFFLERPEDALVDWLRVLRPGGRLAIATHPAPLPSVSLRTWWVRVWGPAMHVYDDAHLAAMIRQAGFADARVVATERVQIAFATRAARRDHAATI